MQHRERDDRDLRDPRDRERFAPPAEYVARRSSFLHGLPPPLSAPRGYYPPSPSVREAHSPSGLTDPSSWSSHQSPSVAHGDLRPSPSRRGWSPPLPNASPRFGDRLPPLTSDYGPPAGGTTRHSWEQSQLPPMPYVKSETFPRPPSRADYDNGGPHDSGMRNTAGQPPSDVPNEAPIISVSTPRPSAAASRPQTAPSSSHSSVSKHGVPASGEAAEPPKKKKRRQAFSCAECAKRKQKCNRQTPCQHCVSRRVPHLCIPSARLGSPPSRPKPKAEEDEASPKKKHESAEASPGLNGEAAAVSGRVSTLEKMLNAVLNRVDGLDSSALTTWRQLHPAASSPPPLHQTPGQYVHIDSSRVSTSAGPRGALEPEESAWASGADSSARRRLPLSDVQEEPLGLGIHGSFHNRLERVVAEGSKVTLREVLQYLPRKDTADKLVAFFFAKENHLWYPIGEELFRKGYESVYQSRGGEVSAGVLALPLIFAVLAFATRFIPDDWAGSAEERRVQSLVLFWQAFASMPISTAINAANIQLVEARLILGLYLVHVSERRLAEGLLQFRSAIALGQTLNLHRDGSRIGLDHYEAESRRRLWSYLCHADAAISCLVGRPPVIDRRFCDTYPPSNVNIEKLIGVTQLPAIKPLAATTSATYLVLRKLLADIISEIAAAFQNLQSPIQYSDVLGIDAKLEQLRTDLPPQFQIVSPDKSRDAELEYLPVQRYCLQTEILHYTIILHRPWFLRNVRSDRCARSRRACFEAAVTGAKIREAYRKDYPDALEALLDSPFSDFNSALMAGICVLVEPRSRLSTDAWNILTQYTNKHTYDSEHAKEAPIIHTLYRRAKAVRDSQAAEEMDVEGDLATHPLQDKTSFERGGSSRGPFAAAADTRPRGLSDSLTDLEAKTAPKSESRHVARSEPRSSHREIDPSRESGTDQLQNLFDHFLAANAELLPWPDALTGLPVDEGSEVGLLGVTGLHNSDYGVTNGSAAAGSTSPQALRDAQYAGDHWLAFAAVPCSHAPPKDTTAFAHMDVNSAQYWDNFADVLEQQLGQSA